MGMAHYLKNAGLEWKDIGSKGAERLGEARFNCPRKCEPSARVGMGQREAGRDISDIETVRKRRQEKNM